MSIPAQELQKVFVKAEGTPGTYDNPAGTDILPVMQGGSPAKVINGSPLIRNDARGSYSHLPGVPSGKTHVERAIQCYMQHSAAAGNEPPWGKLMRALGFDATVVTDTSVKYASPAGAAPAYALSLRDEELYGDEVRAKGCRFGDAVFEFGDGAMGMLSGTLVGAFESAAADAGLSSHTDYAGAPVCELDYADTPWVIDSWVPDVVSFRIRVAHRAVMVPANQQSGRYRTVAHITSTRPVYVLEADVINFNETTYALMAKNRAGTVGGDFTAKWTDGTRHVAVIGRQPQWQEKVVSSGEFSTATITAILHPDTDPALEFNLT